VTRESVAIVDFGDSRFGLLISDNLANLPKFRANPAIIQAPD
jgi:hypothetical protein